MRTPKKSTSLSETPSRKILQHQKIHFIPELKLKVFKSEYFYFHFLSGDFYWLQTQTALRTTVTLNSKGLVRSKTSCQGLGKNHQKHQPQSCSPDQVFSLFYSQNRKGKIWAFMFHSASENLLKVFSKPWKCQTPWAFQSSLQSKFPSLGVSQGCPDSAHPPQCTMIINKPKAML